MKIMQVIKTIHIIKAVNNGVSHKNRTCYRDCIYHNSHKNHEQMKSKAKK